MQREIDLKTVFLLFFLSISCFGEIFGFVEHETVMNRGAKTAVPQLNLWYQQDFHKGSKFGLFTWDQTSQYYSLAEGGLSYRIKPWLQIGGGAGMENIGTKERLVTFTFYSRGKDTVFATIENGGSGRWHQVFYTRRIGRFEAGAMSQEFLGVGPRGAINLGNFKFWSTAFMEKDQGGFNQNFIFGVRYVFFKP